jgi:hypothetical protein
VGAGPGVLFDPELELSAALKWATTKAKTTPSKSMECCAAKLKDKKIKGTDLKVGHYKG